MDAMTLFMILLVGMSLPIAGIVFVILIDAAVVAWMAIDSAYRGLTDVAHSVKVHWIHAAHP